MKIKRLKDAETYESANHFECKALRLAGFEEGSSENFWIGCSHFLPGGSAGPDASPLEKVYVVLSGDLTVIVDGVESIASAMDTVVIPAGEIREIINKSNNVVTILVVMPYPDTVKKGS
ncbi:cupin domain-containing protein [Neptunomonas sp.]|uniref:cupin domain-containing protein n=1 Tax=Neptunomonas sp. TaxID=1971898 RepID=UPI0035657884